MAQGLSDILVSNRLVACTNLVSGVHSTFIWQEAIQNDHEVLIIAKTHQSLLDDIKKVIDTEHPYDTPELIAVPICWGSEEYMQWMEQNVLV